MPISDQEKRRIAQRVREIMELCFHCNQRDQRNINRQTCVFCENKLR